MKILLICGSLLANAILAAVLINRPTLAPPIIRDFFVPRDQTSAAGPKAQRKAEALIPAKLWTQLDTSDLRQLKTRLLAAGFPPNIVRSMIAALVNAQYAAKTRAFMLPDPNVPYWKIKPVFMGLADKRLVEMQQLQRERSKLVKDLTGDLVASDADVTAAQRQRYGNLPPAKIDMIQRIEDDYAEMTSAVRAGMNGIELSEDRDKLALLAKEKLADLSAVMTPDELSEYQMRSSPLTNALRGRLAAFDPSEAEYRSIFQAYQAVGQQFGSTTGIMNMDQATRTSAEQLLASSLQNGLGDTRYNQFLRSTGQDYQQVSRIVQQQNLAPDVPDRVLALRDATAQQSASIAQDSTLTPQDKQAALQTLAQNARLQLSSLLPGDAGQAYAKRANWLTLLDRGAGVAITQPSPPLIIANDRGVTTMGGAPAVRPIPVKRGPH